MVTLSACQVSIDSFQQFILYGYDRPSTFFTRKINHNSVNLYQILTKKMVRRYALINPLCVPSINSIGVYMCLHFMGKMQNV